MTEITQFKKKYLGTIKSTDRCTLSFIFQEISTTECYLSYQYIIFFQMTFNCSIRQQSTILKCMWLNIIKKWLGTFSNTMERAARTITPFHWPGCTRSLSNFLLETLMNERKIQIAIFSSVPQKKIQVAFNLLNQC